MGENDHLYRAKVIVLRCSPFMTYDTEYLVCGSKIACFVLQLATINRYLCF